MPDVADRLNTALAGRYEIQRELGRGGMATVFLAQDLRHRCPVAIKVLDPELAAVLGPERFLREIETVAGLNHPQILPLRDSGSAGDLLYYVMPYVEGSSLRERLKRERQLSVKDALRLVGQVASALDFAHRRGVVHRDIKPENILLVDGQAVVADFGIARPTRPAAVTRLTEPGASIGTPEYMSPEQWTGDATLDGRSDVYSLACVLYELLAGQPPFTGTTADSLRHQHLNVAPRPVSALRSKVPKRGAVDRALETALAKAPADRQATAAEFAEAIATTDPGPPGIERILRMAAIGAALVIAIVGGKLIWDFAHRKPPPTKRAWVLVAEFDGPAADSSITSATRDLVIAGLEESEIVSVVPPDQIRVALRMADKPPSTRVDAELARELAYRSAVRTVLEGRIGRLGKGYSVVLRVVDVDSARVVVSVSDAAADEQALIPTLSRVAKKLRAGLGERRAAIQATHELTEVMTPSFDAFKANMRGFELLTKNDNRGAIEAARRALDSDPDFTSPWGQIGFAFANLGEADSAVQALRRSLAHPDRVNEISRLNRSASIARLNGDPVGALALMDRLVRLHPERAIAHSNRSIHLMGMGRWEEALESTRIGERVSPFGPMQQLLSNQFAALLMLGRLDEARRLAPRLTGSLAKFAPLEIAVAAGQWSAAESLAMALRRDPAVYERERIQAHWILAAAQGSRGDVSAADQTLRGVQSEAEATSDRHTANRARWRRLQLSLFSRGLMTAPGHPGLWDSTTTGVLAHGAWAAAAGDSATARRLLAAVRVRSAPELARQGFMLILAQGWVDMRAGRWQNVVRDLGPAALQGEPIGFIEFGSAPLVRWMMAEAYERIGLPDSAASYFERAIAPPLAGGWDFAHSRMAFSFGHLRLVSLYARMGRLEEARRHWETFSETFTRPDPEMALRIEEARAALAAAEGMARSARR